MLGFRTVNRLPNFPAQSVDALRAPVVKMAQSDDHHVVFPSSGSRAAMVYFRVRGFADGAAEASDALPMLPMGFGGLVTPPVLLAFRSDGASSEVHVAPRWLFQSNTTSFPPFSFIRSITRSPAYSVSAGRARLLMRIVGRRAS